MPIILPIYINDRLIKQYKIGRVFGDAHPDSINTYLVVADGSDWNNGLEFEHRYGDGVEVCIQKAMETIARETNGNM